MRLGPCLELEHRTASAAATLLSTLPHCLRTAFGSPVQHALTWCDRGGNTNKVMSARESAILMGFDSTWRLPAGSRNAQRGIGNALCIEMVRAIMKAAISLQSESSISTPPRELTPMAGYPTPKAAVPATTLDGERLHKRLRIISAAIEELISSSAGGVIGDSD